jgi:hypothetical protein
MGTSQMANPNKKRRGLLANKLFWIIAGAALFIIIGFLIPTPQSMIVLGK